MGVQELSSAFFTNPAGPDIDDLAAELVESIISPIPANTSVVGGVLQIDPVDAETGAVRQGYAYADGIFLLDAADETTAHDGITCIVLIGGYRYKVQGDIRIKAVESVGIDSEPSLTDSDFGKSYIDLTGVVGDANDIITWTSRGWVETDPDYGPPIFVKTSTDGFPTGSYVHWDGSGWVSGVGAGAILDASVPLSAIIGPAASLTIRVENQTTYAPPGSRQTGGTPAAPLGGTASNLNDDDDSTVATTSALNDLSGLTVPDRIVAKLSLASPADLICIEARGVLGSAASSSTAMGLYYSDDNGASWTQAGAGFTLSTSAQNIQRTGSFADVTDIAVVTEAKNWSTNTNTVAGLNAFDATVDVSVGTAFIVGAGAFGILSGHESKVAICEVEDTLTIYTQQDGDEVYDKDTKTKLRWVAAASAWQAAASGYARVTITEDLDAETINATGSNAAQSSSDFPTTAPTQTADKSKVIETLTAAVQADIAGQTIEVEYLASMVSALTYTKASGTDNSVRLLIGVFVDSETDARDWHSLGVVFGSSMDATTVKNALSASKLQALFKLTLADDSGHTLTIVFQLIAAAGTITAFGLPLAHRRIIVRKLSE